MKKPLEIVTEFLCLINDEKDIKGASELMAENIKFTGPAAQVSNATEYVALLEKFLPLHTGWKKYQEFENGNEVCVIDDIIVKTPTNETITLSLTEWFKISDGKIMEHKVFYDPREFVKAFGM